MSIGYACKVIGEFETNLKSCTLKNANPDKLLELIQYNLTALNNTIDYNIENDIKFFRISSDLIPFGSSPANDLAWWEIFKDELSAIGEKIKSRNMRVSLHPGQYTVLNSLTPEVVLRAKDDLEYHTKILDAMGLNEQHKLVLHIGGAYGDKISAINRFCEQYESLSVAIKRRLIIENDDKIYNIEDVLEIGNSQNIPVVFDNLHHKLNAPRTIMSDAAWIEKCKLTWKAIDGKAKIHYSQQAIDKRAGSHSETVLIKPFMEYYHHVNGYEIDIMLEVKDKNLSCVKCIHCTTPNLMNKALEKAWSRYKYSLLERSHTHYLEVRELFATSNTVSALEFYTLIEAGLSQDIEINNALNALLHVWGYFKKSATENEKNVFFKVIDRYKQEEITLEAAKKQLEKLAIKYEQSYVLNSYYFI